MAQRTAVEWLHEIAKQREPDKFDWEQAKQMEKQQIVDALEIYKKEHLGANSIRIKGNAAELPTTTGKFIVKHK
jgi:hypothetical protein